MTKKLSQLTKQELWNLFPIFLVDHNEEWKTWYSEEVENIKSFVSQDKIKRISHVGSTAVKTIMAKNIVDILLEVENLSDLYSISESLQNNDWIEMSRGENQISLNKGYTENGFADRVFHLHLRLLGDNDELYFRDYLIGNPIVAKDYEKLKLSLWKKYEHNRDVYTDSKTDFIKKYTSIAKVEYE